MSESKTLDDRLAVLPAKLQKPFQQLLKVGQIDADAVSTILDAGEIAGEHSRLLAFAVGYLHLKAQRVPIDDVVRMAKDQQRRINLSWSPKRWTAVHNRLSRAQALQTLATEGVVYDVSSFEAVLTKPFPGYFIRSSRRLGMEGLRQRHCVASYHKQLLAGDSAIACVFVDQQRWTVQLYTVGSPPTELRIGQIKTRYNRLPTEDVRERIHEVLGVELGQQASVLSPVQARPSNHMDTLRRVLPVLRAHGVERVTVTFDGSGDEGSIDDICFGDCEIDPSAIEIDITVMRRRWGGGDYITENTIERVDLSAAIEGLTDDYLTETGVDWYNNDGGFGELVIVVTPGTVLLEVNGRYTESTTEFCEERDIVSGEEI